MVGKFLEPEFSEEQILTDLGLTLKQTRVYLALANMRPARVIEISKNSKVARPDVYPALEKLQQLGLAEKLIKNPPEYRAIPMKEAISSLLETKTNQYEMVKARAKILQSTIKTEKPDNEDQGERRQFILVPEGKAVVDKIGAAIENARQNIDVVLSWKRFSHGIACTFTENIEKAWVKNVKIRFIVEKPPKNETSKQMIQHFRDKPYSQLRLINAHPSTIFGIYDRKEVFVIIVPKTDLQDSPALWSDNQALVSLATDYFELLWQQSTENAD